jgi:hypothetical protein
MLYEYIRDYYIPIMKLENTDVVNTFVETIKRIENTNTIDDSFLEAYTHMVNYIRDECKDFTHVNMHFNRMRFHMSHQFKSLQNLPNLEYISF